MLSDTEANALNRKVSAVMGWELMDGLGRLYYESPNSAAVRLLPDFCRDPHALGWMVDWLDSHCFCYELTRGHSDTFYAGLYGKDNTPFPEDMQELWIGDFLGEALVQAIVAYAEAQKEQEADNG